MLVLHGVSIPIGSTIYIKDVGVGAYGCNFSDVVVLSGFCIDSDREIVCGQGVFGNYYTNKKFNYHQGISNWGNGFFVSNLLDGSIWKINPPDENSFIFKNKNVVELI